MIFGNYVYHHYNQDNFDDKVKKISIININYKKIHYNPLKINKSPTLILEFSFLI